MSLSFEDRPSGSPLVERVWRSRSDDIGEMTSIASGHWTLVVWAEGGSAFAAVQGPESRASPAPVPPDATFFGIRFSLGTTLRGLALDRLVDGDIELPDVTRRTLWLGGSRWPRPDFDDAESFVDALAEAGVVARDPVVAGVLDGQRADLSVRTLRRRFLAATGLPHQTLVQIERARRAATLLGDGVPIPEVTHELGYFDHPHLARSLRRFVGHSATELRERRTQLSVLYKP